VCVCVCVCVCVSVLLTLEKIRRNKSRRICQIFLTISIAITKDVLKTPGEGVDLIDFTKTLQYL
jgi:hypothetical protein